MRTRKGGKDGGREERKADFTTLVLKLRRGVVGLAGERGREGNRKAKARGGAKRVDAHTRRTNIVNKDTQKKQTNSLYIHILETKVDDSVVMIVSFFLLAWGRRRDSYGAPFPSSRSSYLCYLTFLLDTSHQSVAATTQQQLPTLNLKNQPHYS